MDPFDIITRWFWLLCIIVTFINAGIFRFRANKQIKVHPELADGYRTLWKGFVTWGNVPWIVMGYGFLAGGITDVFYFFRPRDGNPYVLTFFGSVFLLWAAGTYWLLFRGGARMLVQYPGFFNYQFKSPAQIIFFWFACLAGGIMGVVMMYTRDIPIPFR